MNVKLVAVTSPRIDGLKNAEDIVSYCARVSNPSNQMNTETAPRLLKYLIKHQHWSPFEMASVTVEIVTSRAIAAQILRHRSFAFQEFCITGDSLVTTLNNSGKSPNYIPIKKLYERQSWKNYKDILVRVYDEKNKIFVTSKIKEVFKTGVKPVYEVTLSDGKKIKCTKEHKFFSDGCFDSLENIVGLDSKHHCMTKIGHIATNGIPCYQDKKWLSNAKNESIENKGGVAFIAEKAGVSYHTIRKWLKKLDLKFTKKEVAFYNEIWNKGKFGYNTSLKHSKEHIEAIRFARSGKKSNFWKGGQNRSERLKITDWCQKIRKNKLIEYKYSCKECKSSKKLELDHIVPVWQDHSLAYSESNIQVLCEKCHDKKHLLSGEVKMWREKSRGNLKTIKYVKIEKIKFLGEQETYDLEVEHESHNYVANKILVHNSQRYSTATKLEDIQWRLQGKTNRQVGDAEVDLSSEKKELVDKALQSTLKAYDALIQAGVAKECARMVLPLTTQTTMYMTGTLRSWIHYIELRAKEDTQKEHREIAVGIKNIFMNEFPVISEALGWINTTV